MSANPWEQDYTVKEDQPSTGGNPWEQNYFRSPTYGDSVRAEESEWEQFWHSFQKAKNLTESAGQLMETKIPLGRIQITDPETGELSIKYVPPSQDLKDAVAAGDDEAAVAILNGEREARLQAMYPDLYTPEGVQKKNTENLAGTMLGFMADPTSLIPFAAGWKGMAASGAAFGGIDAGLFSMAKDGELDFGDVALGMAAGAALPLAFKTVGKGFGVHQWQDSVKSARTLLDRFDKRVLEEVSKGVPLDVAKTAAAVKTGFRNGMADVVRAGKKAGRLPVEYKNLKPQQAADALEQIELNAREKFFNKHGYLKSAAEFAGDYLVPITTRIKNISPRLFHALRKMDMQTHVRVQENMQKVEPWLQFVGKLRKFDSATSDRMKKALLGERFDQAYGLMGRLEGTHPEVFKGMREAFNSARTTLDEMADEAIAQGYKIKKVKSYYPKIVRNPQGLGVIRKSRIASDLAREEKRLGRKLKPSERAHYIEKIINGYTKETGKVSTNLRQRKYNYMLDEMLPHYAELDESMVGYIRELTHTIERRKFLKAHATPEGKKGGLPKANVKKEDVTDSVAAILDKERQRLRLSPEDEDRLTQALVARFGPGERAPREGIRTFKNITYGATLGNIISAITQLGDNAFGMFLHGVRPHMRALGQNLKGSKLIPGKRADDFVEKTLIGLTEITDDIQHDTSKSKKFLDTLMKWSGFAKMDKFGKENLINGALNLAKKQVKTEKGRNQFIAKWGPYFEGETYSLLKKIEKGAVDDENVKLFLWHSLADAQPIGLSEMPLGYLNHPNGRVFYMLKTFTIKQLDLMRREIFDLIAEGRTGEAAQKMAMFGTFFMLWNGGAEAFKDVLKGKDVEIPDIAVNNMIKLTGLSRWETSKFGRNGPLETISQMIIPPYPIDDLYKGAVQGDPVKAAKALPYVGFLSGWAKDE